MIIIRFLEANYYLQHSGDHVGVTHTTTTRPSNLFPKATPSTGSNYFCVKKNIFSVSDFESKF